MQMKRIAVCLITVVVIFLFSVASGFGWGTDVQIYSGQVCGFDVDYDLGSGTMFVAFWPTGEGAIKLYSSMDHGLHWSLIRSFPTYQVSGTGAHPNVHRLKVIYNNGWVHIFWIDSDGTLKEWRCSSTGGSRGGSPVSIFPIAEGSFSVTLDPESGTMYAAYRTAVIHGAYSHYLDVIKFSKDDGLTWTFIKHPESYIYSPGFNYRRYCLAFAPGVENHVYAAYTTVPPVDYPAPADASHLKKIAFMRVPTDDSGNLDRFKNITDNAVENTDARVAAAYVDDSGVWVVYNRGGRGAYQQDLLNAYSPNGGITWNYLDQPIAAQAGIDEYVADLKYYRAPGNSYVNMVYIKDDPSASPQRQAVWMYASTADPSWKSPTLFSDQEVQSFPEDTAPRIVYSPGASAPGGGVVFSYAGAQGLYFDAPWITGSSSYLPPPGFPHLPVYPMVKNHTLTVTIHGSGSVVSEPAGLDCTHNSLGDAVCTYNFSEGTAVALTATSINGSDYTSSFLHWSGDCSGSGACPLVMDSDKSVEANFGALGTPVFALPVPAGQEAWSYPPQANPLLQSEPAHCKPFAVGDLTTGNLNLRVGLPPFSAGVDVYLALEYAGSWFLINSSNELKSLSALTALPRWKTNASFSDIDEPLYGAIPLSLLPSGLYNVYLVVTPTGDTDFNHYYFWSTYFLAP